MLDEMISKLNEKRYDMDELYFKIMGCHPVAIGSSGEQTNSVFYSWTKKWMKDDLIYVYL